jgi:hypothetical protein
MEEQSFVPKGSSGISGVFNLLAIVFLVLSCVSLVCVGAVFANPGILPEAFQPQPIPATITLIPTPTATNTSVYPTFPPTWTPETPTVTSTREIIDTATATATETPRVTRTNTRVPSRTPTRTPAGPTATKTPTRSTFQYTLQSGSPSYLANFANTAGCNWMGIAGQVFNMSGQAVVGLLVHLDGGGLNYDSYTGSKTAYGPGGYELYLNDHAVQTTNVYHIQLRNQGAPVSDTYVINTFADCNKNLILVNFAQNH